MKNDPFGNHILHTDTTNFSLYGNYENRDHELNTIEITYGHPEDMRWDLKRYVLSFFCLRCIDTFQIPKIQFPTSLHRAE